MNNTAFAYKFAIFCNAMNLFNVNLDFAHQGYHMPDMSTTWMAIAMDYMFYWTQHNWNGDGRTHWTCKCIVRWQQCWTWSVRNGVRGLWCSPCGYIVWLHRTVGASNRHANHSRFVNSENGLYKKITSGKSLLGVAYLEQSDSVSSLTRKMMGALKT